MANSREPGSDENGYDKRGKEGRQEEGRQEERETEEGYEEETGREKGRRPGQKEGEAGESCLQEENRLSAQTQSAAVRDREEAGASSRTRRACGSGHDA